MAHPTQIHLKEAQAQLAVTWSDDHTFTYALRYLRGWCPCAHCQGHFAERKRFIHGVSCTLRSVEPVGNYALMPIWGDGHKSGIYTFTYLKALEAGPPGEGPDNNTCLQQHAGSL